MPIDLDNFHEYVADIEELCPYTQDELRKLFPRSQDDDLLSYARSIELNGTMREPLGNLIPSLVSHLDNKYLTGWHQTRVLYASSVIDQGLILHDWDTFASRISSICESLQIPSNDIPEVILSAKKYYKRDDKRQKICFYSAKRLEEKYLKYSEALGGETLTWVIESLKNEVYLQKLRTTGIPLAVKFRYPFRKLCRSDQERAALAIIRVMIVWRLYGEEIPVEFDACISCGIEGSDLLDIVTLTDNYYETD